jgi:hypothetical protein
VEEEEVEEIMTMMILSSSYFIKYSGVKRCQRWTWYAHKEQEKEELRWTGKG